MEDTINTQFTNDIAPLPARPQFLKVLCILTWICCGLVFISALFGLVGQSTAKQQESIEQIREMDPETADRMEEVINEAQVDGTSKTINTTISFLAVILSAIGAVMMWQLKKTGFYIYVVAELLPYLGFAIGGANAMSAMSSMAGGMGAAIAGVVVGMMVIFDLAFIIMYAVNLKYMNK